MARHPHIRFDERRYEALLSASTSFVWRTDAEGSLVEIDDSWLTLTGLSTEQSLDWGWLVAVHPEDRVLYRESWLAAVNDGAPFELIYRLECQDEQVRWFVDRAEPVRDEAGAILEWIGIGRDITERMHSRRAIERQRERYRVVVESTSAVLWEGYFEPPSSDRPRNFRFSFVNSQAEVLLGYPLSRWTEEPSFWVDHMHPDDRVWAPQYTADESSRGRQHSFDYRMIAADGRLVWLRDVVSVVADGLQPAKLVGVMIDVTASKDTERALEYVSGLQQTLVEVSRGLVGAPAADGDPITEALARVGAYCGADRSYMVRIDGETMSMTHEWCAPHALPAREQLQRVPRAAALAQFEAMDRREVLHLPRVAALDEAWQPEKGRLLDQGVQSLISVPVVSRERVWGALGLTSDASERRWNEQEVHALQSLADTIGATLERDHADQARLASEARLSAIAEHLPGVVFQRVRAPDGQMRVTYLSGGDGGEQKPERAAARADDQSMIDRVDPEDQAYLSDQLERSARTLTPHDFQFRLRMADGETRWVRSIGRPRANTDGSVVWDGIALDETDRIVAERSLRESQALLEIAGQTARLGGWRLDPAAGRVRWSDEVCAIYEVPAGTHPSLDEALEFVAPEWRDHMRRAIETGVREGSAFNEEVEVITAARRRRWVRIIGEAVCDSAGSVLHVRGALQDITEGKHNEREIRRLAERLTTTLESITDAFFTVDRDWRFTYVNGEAERLLERSRDTLLGGVVWDEFPEAVGSPLDHAYRRAVRDQSTVTLEEYYAPLDKWLEVHAYPSDEGLAVYFRDVTERKKAEQDIQFLALYDPLTQLPNRRLLSDRLQHAMAGCIDNGTYGAIAFLDVDDFKTLNDTLGHHIGDELLQAVAWRLTEALPDRCTVARFGGDEFAIVLPNLGASAAQAVAAAREYGERILGALNRPYYLADHERHTTVSLGLTTFDGQHANSPHDVIQRADLAMYRAKDAGRSSMRVFEPSMRTALSERVALEADLRKAIESDEIVPYYQPVVGESGRVIGAEALARWQHPARGLIPPSEFIPVAEQTGLILSLGQHMLAQACRQIAAWTPAPPFAGPWQVSVNISAHEFHQRDFVARVRAEVARAGADPARLCLELTESFLLQDVEGTIAKMNALKGEGIRFSLDDFGTGYSSLAYLKRLPLDQVKIDQAFVADLKADSPDAAIVQAIVVLAENFGLAVIAEGVENEAIRNLLAGFGCRTYQGYLFSRPLPLGEFEAFLREHATA